MLVASALLLGAVLLAVTLPGVRSDLTASRDALTRSQELLSDGKLAEARAALTTAARRAEDADGTTHTMLWRWNGRVPVLRSSVRELQAMSRALAVTTDRVLPPLLDVSTQPRWSGRVDTATFARLQGPLTEGQRSLEEVRRRLRVAPHSGIAQVAEPRQQLDDGLSRLALSLNEARVASIVVPQMASGTHRYLLVAQNNAEPRATGGLIGSYGLLEVSDGRFRLLSTGPNNELVDRPRPVVDVGQEYDARYGRFGTTRVWRSANLSPDVPTAGRILVALAKDQFGTQLDGVVFVDPVALSRLLGATGALTLGDGTRIDEKTAVQALLVDVYARFPRRADAERNRYLESAMRQVVDRLGRPGLNGDRVLQRVAAAVASGHLQVYSSSPEVEALLRTSKAGGALAASGPFLSVVTQDAGGSKLGAYLRRSVRYDARSTGAATDLGTGPRLEERGTVTVRLTNAAPAGLPTYVTDRPDDPSAPEGQAHYWVSVYLGNEATLLEASIDGETLALESATEEGLTVFSTFVKIDRGMTRTLVLRVTQPSRPGQPLTWRQQPLLRSDDLVVDRGGAPLERLYAD